MTTKSFRVMDNGDIIHIESNKIIGRIGQQSIRAKFRTMIGKTAAQLKIFFVFLESLGKASSQATNGTWNRKSNSPS